MSYPNSSSTPASVPLPSNNLAGVTAPLYYQINQPINLNEADIETTGRITAGDLFSTTLSTSDINIYAGGELVTPNIVSLGGDVLNIYAPNVILPNNQLTLGDNSLTTSGTGAFASLLVNGVSATQYVPICGNALYGGEVTTVNVPGLTATGIVLVTPVSNLINASEPVYVRVFTGYFQIVAFQTSSGLSYNWYIPRL